MKLFCVSANQRDCNRRKQDEKRHKVDRFQQAIASIRRNAEDLLDEIHSLSQAFVRILQQSFGAANLLRRLIAKRIGRTVWVSASIDFR